MIRVVLTDDHKLIRDGLKALLKDEPAIEVVGEASDGDELIGLLKKTAVDVVLLDLNMPGKDGFELTKYIRQHHAGVKVLVLSMLEHERYVHQAIAEGASGYLLKNAGKEELSSAIKLVATGTPYICSNFTIDLLKKTHAPEGHAEQQAAQQPERRELTKRELEVLNLIGQGYTNAEIAEKLFTSKRTVETHRQNLLEKTHTKNTATLIKYAIQNGIIS